MDDIKSQVTKILADKKTWIKIGVIVWSSNIIFNNLLRDLKSNCK